MATTVNTETEGTLRNISSGNVGFLENMLMARLELEDASGLDPKSFSLCKIAALIALDAPPASYGAQVTLALASGVSPEEILGVLTAVAPQVGVPKVVAAAPEIAWALGVAIEES